MPKKKGRLCIQMSFRSSYPQPEEATAVIKRADHADWDRGDVAPGKMKGFRVYSKSELTRFPEESDVEDEKMRGVKLN